MHARQSVPLGGSLIIPTRKRMISGKSKRALNKGDAQVLQKTRFLCSVA